MSNIVELDQYRELRRLLTEDEGFRNWVRAFLAELDNPQPTLDFSNFKSPYTVTSVTYNGIDITDN